MAKKSSKYPENHTVPGQTAGFGSPDLLEQEYLNARTLFEAQPQTIQRFFESQARQLVDAILRNQLEARFLLPDRVVEAVAGGEKSRTLTIPADQREQVTGSVIDRLTRADMRVVLRQRLNELESSMEPGIATSAGLLRFAIATYMVHNQLPAGRSVHYVALDGEEIPTLPSEENVTPDSAITATTDAIAEEGTAEASRGELQAPFVPAARRFYLPQWVAFDLDGNLLVKSVNEAEAHIDSMKRFLSILHNAISFAPYILCDPVYQQKRYGILGQLINQGRALAMYETNEMIRVIKRRAANNDLNRGLSLSLPYFDDQDLMMRVHEIEVIPAGRILFVPAFVVRAAREEMAKVAQDTRLSASTREYLLAELTTIERAFFTPGKSL